MVIEAKQPHLKPGILEAKIMSAWARNEAKGSGRAAVRSRLVCSLDGELVALYPTRVQRR
jgi:hypothetical protein